MIEGATSDNGGVMTDGTAGDSVAGPAGAGTAGGDKAEAADVETTGFHNYNAAEHSQTRTFSLPWTRQWTSPEA